MPCELVKRLFLAFSIPYKYSATPYKIGVAAEVV
jgi:hypothetical protein